MDDHVHLALAELLLGSAEVRGKLFPGGLLDYAAAGELHDGPRLGQDDVRGRGPTCEDPARRGVGQDGDVGKAGLTHEARGRDGLGHLHEGEDPLLHARAARRGGDYEGPPVTHGRLSQPVEALAQHRAHGAAHELEVHDAQRHRMAGDAAQPGQHGLGEPGLLLSLGDALRIGSQVEELQRVRRTQLVGDEGHGSRVGQQSHPGRGRHGVVVAAIGADVVALLHLAIVQAMAALLALRPGDFHRSRRLPPRDLHCHIFSHSSPDRIRNEVAAAQSALDGTMPCSRSLS